MVFSTLERCSGNIYLLNILCIGLEMKQIFAFIYFCVCFSTQLRCLINESKKVFPPPILFFFSDMFLICFVSFIWFYVIFIFQNCRTLFFRLIFTFHGIWKSKNCHCLYVSTMALTKNWYLGL